MRCEILRHDGSCRVRPPHGVMNPAEFGVLRTWRADTWPRLMGLRPSRYKGNDGRVERGMHLKGHGRRWWARQRAVLEI